MKGERETMETQHPCHAKYKHISKSESSKTFTITVIPLQRMDWPSKNVSPGGFYQPAKVKYSPETKNFIKLLMEESKLTMMQRQKLNYSLRTGTPLPDLRSRRDKSNIKEPLTIRPGSSKRRSWSTIVQSGAYDRETFIPKPPIEDREAAKKRLQSLMAYGEDKETVFKQPEVRTNRKPEEKPAKVKNRFDELVEEIKERVDWLAEMEELGEGIQHRAVIQQQIAARIREMERLKPAKTENGSTSRLHCAV